MDQTDFVKTGLFALIKILFDDADNLFGLKRMQIQAIFDAEYDDVPAEWVEFSHCRQDFIAAVHSPASR